MTVSDDLSPEHGEQHTHKVDSSSCSSSSSSDGESENGDSDNQSNLRHYLYPGSSTTILETVLLLGTWFTQYSGVTKKALESLLKLLAHILPKEHRLPNTYKQFLRLLRPQQLQSFHMCPNGCRAYYGELTDAERCPECNAKRYRMQPRSWAYRPKRRRLDRLPRRTFKVLPLIPRLKQVLESDRMVGLLTHHHNVTSPSNGYINDLHQTDHWKSLFVNGGIMEGDRRNLVLAISIDGVNPFRKRSTDYSMWPVYVHILNLSPELRYSFAHSFLTTIIPGSSLKNISSFLRPVIDEFVQLFDQGIVLSDGSIVRGVTDILVMDYEAQSKVLCMKGQGAIQGCHLCTIQGQYVHNLRKVVYLNNRAYIRLLSHHLRSATVYFNSNPEDLDIPEPRNHEDIIAQGRECLAIRQRIQEGIITERVLREYQKKTGVNGPTAVEALPGVRLGLHGNVPVDFMHLQRNVLVHLFQCLTGDSVKVGDHVLREERDHGRFLDLWPSEANGEDDVQPLPGPWELTPEEVRIANDRAMSICLPIGFGFKSGSWFTNYQKIHRTSDWLKLVTTRILKFCLRGLLGERQRLVLFRLLDCLRDIAASVHTAVSLDALESLIHETLAEVELNFPAFLQVVMLHLHHHSVVAIRKYGTVYSTWMF